MNEQEFHVGDKVRSLINSTHFLCERCEYVVADVKRDQDFKWLRLQGDPMVRWWNACHFDNITDHKPAPNQREYSEGMAELIERLVVANIKLYHVCDQKAGIAKNGYVGSSPMDAQYMTSVAQADIALCRSRAAIRAELNQRLGCPVAGESVKAYGTGAALTPAEDKAASIMGDGPSQCTPPSREEDALPRGSDVVLILDNADLRAVSDAIERRKAWQLNGKTIMPDGTSSETAALIAEICRGWMEQLDMTAAKHKAKASTRP